MSGTTVSRPAAPAAPSRAAGRRRQAGGMIERWSIVGALVLLTAGCIAVFPQFRTAALFTTMVNAQSLVLLLALTATVVLRLGDFDLSISQTMVASAATFASLSSAGVPIWLALLAAVALGAVVGAINAILVVWIGVDSFVATLGAFTALSGLAYLITGSKVVTGVPQGLVDFTRAQFLDLPTVTWLVWLLAVVLWYVYERTPFGRFMVFIGGNRTAARLSGVPVTRIRTATYVASAVLAAVVGLLFAGYFGAVDPSVGSQYMLQPFAAAYLGATAITAGRFNAFGTVAALYLLAVGITALQLVGAQTWVSNVFYGLALMVAVTAARLAGGRR